MGAAEDWGYFSAYGDDDEKDTRLQFVVLFSEETSTDAAVEAKVSPFTVCLLTDASSVLLSAMISEWSLALSV